MIQILAKFHVFVPDDPSSDPKKVDFTAGEMVDEADIPAGQSAQDWIDKGLAKAVSTAPAGAEPAHEAGTAV